MVKERNMAVQGSLQTKSKPKYLQLNDDNIQYIYILKFAQRTEYIRYDCIISLHTPATLAFVFSLSRYPID